MGTHRYLNSDSPGNKEMTVHLFRDRARATDPLWDVASATQMLVADPKSVMSLAPEPDPGSRTRSSTASWWRPGTPRGGSARRTPR